MQQPLQTWSLPWPCNFSEGHWYWWVLWCQGTSYYPTKSFGSGLVHGTDGVIHSYLIATHSVCSSQVWWANTCRTQSVGQYFRTSNSNRQRSCFQTAPPAASLFWRRSAKMVLGSSVRHATAQIIWKTWRVWVSYCQKPTWKIFKWTFQDPTTTFDTLFLS